MLFIQDKHSSSVCVCLQSSLVQSNMAALLMYDPEVNECMSMSNFLCCGMLLPFCLKNRCHRTAVLVLQMSRFCMDPFYGIIKHVFFLRVPANFGTTSAVSNVAFCWFSTNVWQWVLRKLILKGIIVAFLLLTLIVQKLHASPLSRST